MEKKLQVMVVDDTITYRAILKRVIETIPNVDVTATASNGQLALSKIPSARPDVILLDVEMPQMDGLTTLKNIQAHYKEITVVMVSGVSRSNANIVMECLNAGAMDFVTKPDESSAARAESALREHLLPIFNLIASKRQMAGPQAAESPGPAHHRPAHRPPEAVPAASPRVAPRPGVKPPKPELILIGSSTGGPAALTNVLSGLSRRAPTPILIVQHMPPVFTASLSAQLTRSAGIVVREAQDGLPVVPGEAILAQGGYHMVLSPGSNGGWKVTLNDGPKVNECRPAVDVLFMSVAAMFKGNILSVILTGMGRDGSRGVDALKRRGNAWCLTQEKSSCVVYGMPRAVDEMGLSDESLPLGEIGPKILEICAG